MRGVGGAGREQTWTGLRYFDQCRLRTYRARATWAPVKTAVVGWPGKSNSMANSRCGGVSLWKLGAKNVHIQDVATMKLTVRQKRKIQAKEEQETAAAMTGAMTMTLTTMNFEPSVVGLTLLDHP